MYIFLSFEKNDLLLNYRFCTQKKIIKRQKVDEESPGTTHMEIHLHPLFF